MGHHLFDPFDNVSDKDWRRLAQYFRIQPGAYSRKQAREFLYAGDPFVPGGCVELGPLDDSPLRATLEVRVKEGGFFFEDMNLRQLLVVSSRPEKIDASEPTDWCDVDPQTRLEVCQNDLSRWSVTLKSHTPVPEWDGARTPQGLRGHEWCDAIELVNNCTTSQGFELKVWTQGRLLHGSFAFDPQIYRLLCRRQAGTWAHQGWEGEPNSGLLDPGAAVDEHKNPSFAQVYHAEQKAHASVRLDLGRYRRLVDQRDLWEGEIHRTTGPVQYRRWVDTAEYFDKPFVRHLVMDRNASREDSRAYIDPPALYEDVQAESPSFKLPQCQASGIYNPLEPVEKKFYSQLADLTRAEIRCTSSKLHELTLVRPCAQELDLHRIVIGNLDLRKVPGYPRSLVIDRFCYAPRPTSMLYDDTWRPPAHEEAGDSPSAMYACLLAQGGDWDENSGTFLQPESWGVERAILSRTPGGRHLVIDLMSFEHIVPVWQGYIDLNEFY